MSPVTVIENHLDEIATMITEGVGEIAFKTAEWIGGSAKDSMGEEKTGRAYKRGEKEHVASAPGEAPATDMGFLVNTIATEKNEDGTGAVTYTTAEYAVPLEFGSVRMASRPFFTPAAFKAVTVAWQLTQKFIQDLNGRFPRGQ